VSHRKELDDHSAAGFRVNSFGDVDHSEVTMMKPCKLIGEQHLAIGKRFGYQK
jgi:hypothetical protein